LNTVYFRNKPQTTEMNEFANVTMNSLETQLTKVKGNYLSAVGE
jgi:hypothetical protein